MATQTQTKTQAEKDIDQATKRIRDLNEQVLDFGRHAGMGFLEAYEQNLQTCLLYTSPSPRDRS